MADKQPAQVSAGDAQPLGQGIDRATLAIKRAFFDDEPCCTLHCGEAAFPGRTKRGRFRAAAEARAESGGFGRSGTRQELDITAQRQPYRADAPAINARRSNADEESAIERRVARQPGPLADRVVVLVHGATHTTSAGRRGG